MDKIELFEGIEIILSGEGALDAFERVSGHGYNVEINGGLTRLRIENKTCTYIVHYGYNKRMVNLIEKKKFTEVVWSRDQ